MLESNDEKEIKLFHKALIFYYGVLENDYGFLGEDDQDEVMMDMEKLSDLIGELESKYEWLQGAENN